MDFEREGVAFRIFFAIGDEADAGSLNVVHALHIGRAHVRELDEVDGAGIGIGADIEDDGLAEARRAMEQQVIDGLGTGARGLDKDLEVVAYILLTDERGKALGP